MTEPIESIKSSLLAPAIKLVSQYFKIGEPAFANPQTAPQIVQRLWSGYGAIVRFTLPTDNSYTAQPSSVIVKIIDPPAHNQSQHPRGWNSEFAHQRKLRSYQVEAHWYQHWAPQLQVPSPLNRAERESSAEWHTARIAHCYTQQQHTSQRLLLLEDLDATGFAKRHQTLTPQQCRVCLQWLARLHGRFVQHQPATNWMRGLWPQGSYWHLQTRLGEWNAMQAGPLKSHAEAIDQRLRQCPYQTLIHGDAKVANFCFSDDDKQVAAVDFQYIGAGVGVQDVAYFMGSCLSDEQCQNHWQQLLDYYFSELQQAVAHKLHIDANALEEQWRALFAFAWADFERFLMGWEPRHKKLTGFSKAMTQEAINELKIGS